jgi:predicted nucleic acid-binding protein
MKVLVDTSVWSQALRNKKQNALTKELAELIRESMVVMIGPVRQELLSGIRDEGMFLSLKSTLAHFEDEQIVAADYETAARFFNTCCSHCVQGSYTDFLLCAIAANRGLHIFTADAKFEHLAMHLPVRLYQVSR